MGKKQNMSDPPVTTNREANKALSLTMNSNELPSASTDSSKMPNTGDNNDENGVVAKPLAMAVEVIETLADMVDTSGD